MRWGRSAMSLPAYEPDWMTPAPSPKGSLIGGLVRSARPRQWLKNLLVLAAPGAAGVLTHPSDAARAVAAFALFCAASSGTYLINDALDAEADRLHPTKRRRPVAAGEVSVAQARLVGLALIALSVGLSPLLGLRTTLVVGLYVGITLAYSLRLKQEPVIEMAALTTGFVLRALAGGVACSVPLSNWFIIVASFGSLFMVGGKRYSEYQSLGEERSGHRVALGQYTLSYLRYVRSVSSSVAVAGYCLWAFEKASPQGHAARGAIWFELSIAPFVTALLRYALILEAGGGGAPEDVVIGDRLLQVLGGLWLIVFALGVYGIGGR
jgi:decaprenyl-phosphate phosphoribosyltransferase